MRLDYDYAMTDSVKIAIVGSGPSGLSAAAHAAELGIPHVLLESEKHARDTIYKYQKGKHVMAEPSVLPLRSPMSFGAGHARKGHRRVGRGAREIQGQHPLRRRRHRHHRTERRVHAEACQGRDRRRRKRRAGHRPAGQPAQAGRARRGLARRPVPARRSEGIRGRDDPRRRRGRCRHRERAGAVRAKPRHHHQPQRRIRALQGRQPQSRARGDQGRQARVPLFDVGHQRRNEARREGCPAVFNAKTLEGTEAIPCHRVIARLGATPPRKLVESFGVQFPERRPGVGAAAVRHLRVERARPFHRRRAGRLPADQAGDEPGLRGRRVHPRQSRRARRRAAAAGQVQQLPARQVGQRRHRADPEERADAGEDHDAAAARVPDRQRHPRAGARRRHLQPQRLHEHVLLDRRGQRRHRDQCRHARGADRAARSRPVLRRAGPHFRPPSRGDGARGQRRRADRDAAPVDAEAHRVGGRRAPRDRPRLPAARRPRLPVAGPAAGGPGRN